MNFDLVDLQFKPEFLSRYQLPQIGYPVTPHALELMLDKPSSRAFGHMLFGLQLRCSERGADWRTCEAGLDRLAELIAPDDQRGRIEVAGDTWWAEIAPVELARPVVTIQRGQELIAAIAKRADGRLRVASYRPLDSKSADLIMNLALRPHPADGTVCMRENNWEYALDCAAGSGQWYAYERGEAHLSYWRRGLGLVDDGSVNEVWRAQLNLTPRRPAKIATELGVRFALGADS